MKCFKNVKAYIKDRGIITTDITFGDRIAAVDMAEGEQIEIPGNAVVLPGFIDEHIHGAGGADTMDGSITALSAIAKTVAAEGVTGFLATTMTQSRETLFKAVMAVKEYRLRKFKDGAEILGVHLEGPFISERYAGAQPSAYISDADIEFADGLIAACGCVKMVTLAPEKRGAAELIKYLSKNGITVSIGHTAAKYEAIVLAVESGAQCVTHVFNAQSPFHHRDIGTVGGALLTDALATELIADTFHVGIPAIKLLYKNKPPEKVILITDAMRAKGLSNGESELGGQRVFVEDGKARLKDGTLAGSVLKMNDAVKNLVERVGVPFENAVDAATLNPAKNLKISQTHGSIEEGKYADFTVLDNSYKVLLTVRAGEIIFQA